MKAVLRLYGFDSKTARLQDCKTITQASGVRHQATGDEKAKRHEGMKALRRDGVKET